MTSSQTNSNERSLTLNGMSIPNALLIVVAIAMVGVSIYLTKHYFDAIFPEGLQAKSSCNISAFWNCDNAVFSRASNIWDVPIAFFGMMMGIAFLAGAVFPSRRFESTNRLLAVVNAAGCISLALFSTFFLKGLCPFCFVYWVLSVFSAWLFWKYGVNEWMPSFKVIGLLAIPALIGAGALKYQFHNQKVRLDTEGKLFAEQFIKLPVLGDPKVESPYRLVSSTPKFADAPLRISIYSDFECPYCKLLAENTSRVFQSFQGKINVQYFPYPLDQACNAGMQRAMHQWACQAAYLALCSKEKFAEVHDLIYENQEILDGRFVRSTAERYGVTACIANPETRNEVIRLMETGKDYNIQGTPMLVVNGIVISAALTSAQWNVLLSSILEKQNAKK